MQLILYNKFKTLFIMKKLVSLFLVLLTVSFVSCSKDDSPNDDAQDELYLKFTYNGQQYNFNPETITSLQKAVSGQQETNSIITRLVLWMPVDPSIGNHPITDETPTDTNLETLYNAELWVGDATFIAMSGTLVITEKNDEFIKGTFSFSGEDENGNVGVISDGTFSAYN